MKTALAISLSLFCTLLGAAETPLRPTGSDWPPVIGAWFWNDKTLEPDGYKPFLDAAAARTPYTLLSTSLRVSKGEVTDPSLREQIGKAVRYAGKLGLKVAFDLDLRLARRAFQARYPNELQEELVLRIVDVPTNAPIAVTFEGQDLTDHMTGNSIPYRCLATRLVRAYAFTRSGAGIDPDTVREIPSDGIQPVADEPRRLTVTVPPTAGPSVCVVAIHTYLTPDVFAPHLLTFQREIVRQYSDLPLAGVMKDEWGFPPDHSGNPAHDRYWYSAAFSHAYALQTGGRDLIRDALLMFVGENGRETERLAAINHYRKLCRERNAAIEEDYYQAGKATFGSNSFVVTHATWTPYPGVQEFRKHGLDWWEARRDIGQSDESTPYPCRTSLAKRWGFPLWYNQYYSPNAEDYVREFWAGALSGGRLNVHPLYPRPDITSEQTHLTLTQHGLMTGMSRLRMLDFITDAPLNCPVAVIFGHANAMNWAGPAYNRVGLELAASLCAKGYPTDLIPTSLATLSALRLDTAGYVCLGPQRYRAVVLYQPEFGDQRELSFFSKVAQGKSALFLVGDWTRDFDAHTLEATTQLVSKARALPNGDAGVAAIVRFLEESRVAPVTGWRLTGSTGVTPPREGFATLADGTYLRVAGAKCAEGDPIQETFTWQGHTVSVDAVGLVAVRFAADGKLGALAVGGLKHFKTDGLELTLSERCDLAFRTDSNGSVRGVVQGLRGNLPAMLQAITPNWMHLTAFPPGAN